MNIYNPQKTAKSTTVLLNSNGVFLGAFTTNKSCNHFKCYKSSKVLILNHKFQLHMNMHKRSNIRVLNLWIWSRTLHQKTEQEQEKQDFLVVILVIYVWEKHGYRLGQVTTQTWKFQTCMDLVIFIDTYSVPIYVHTKLSHIYDESILKI